MKPCARLISSDIAALRHSRLHELEKNCSYRIDGVLWTHIYIPSNQAIKHNVNVLIRNQLEL